MIALDELSTQAPPKTRRRAERRAMRKPKSHVNVGEAERAASVAAGGILLALGLVRRSIPGMLIAGIGGALAYRGASGRSYLYDALGVNTAKRGIHIEQAFLISKPAEELYRFWRDFRNLPGIMTHLERVDVLDDTRSFWVARAPAIAGGKVEWHAEITRDDPNELIAWRSLPDSQVDNAGQIRFKRAMGDRGTEVHVYLEYNPPAGRLGHWAATLFGESPQQQIRDDLRNFKRLMETGEIPTIIGQPHGTCTSQGEEYSE